MMHDLINIVIVGVLIVCILAAIIAWIMSSLP